MCFEGNLNRVRLELKSSEPQNSGTSAQPITPVFREFPIGRPFGQPRKDTDRQG